MWTAVVCMVAVVGVTGVSAAATAASKPTAGGDIDTHPLSQRHSAPPLPLDGGEWVKDSSSDAAPRYYGNQCWLLRPSYNCVGDPRVSEKHLPPAWAWHWRPEPELHPSAIDNFIDQRGGVAAIAHARKVVQSTRRHPAASEANVTNILMIGGAVNTDSCEVVTDMHFSTEYAQQHPLPIRCLTSQKLPINGSFTPECHNRADTLRHYFKQSAPKQQLPLCFDSVSSVHLTQGNLEVRVHYMYRPYMWGGPAGDGKPGFAVAAVLLQELGLDLADVDIVVHLDNFGYMPGNNAQRDSFLGVLVERRLALKRPLPFVLDLTAAHRHLAVQQQHQFGFKYGAINGHTPHQTTTLHGCMPGWPDDNVNLMWVGIARGAGFQASQSPGTNVTWAAELAK